MSSRFSGDRPTRAGKIASMEYPSLVVPIVLPNVIWLGLFAGVLSGLVQFGFHGVSAARPR